MFARHHARLDGVAHSVTTSLRGAQLTLGHALHSLTSAAAHHGQARAPRHDATALSDSSLAVPVAHEQDQLVTVAVAALCTRLWLPGANLAFAQALYAALDEPAGVAPKCEAGTRHEACHVPAESPRAVTPK